MSTLATRVFVVVAALLVLGAVNYSIVGKESVIRTGETVYVELAPVDPRSLMQGDYMALRFRLAEDIENARDAATLGADARSAPLNVDERGVATLGPGAGDAQIDFRVRNGSVWLGTNAYFFAEGSADRYSPARYGVFRVRRSDGEAVLVGLADADLNDL